MTDAPDRAVAVAADLYGAATIEAAIHAGTPTQ